MQQGEIVSSRYDNASASWVVTCAILMFFMVGQLLLICNVTTCTMVLVVSRSVLLDQTCSKGNKKRKITTIFLT